MIHGNGVEWSPFQRHAELQPLTTRVGCVLILFMTCPSPFTVPALSGRLAPIIAGLCRAVASQAVAHRALAPLLVLVWSRLRRMAARFACLAGRADAGALPSRGVPRPRASGPRPSGSRERLPPGLPSGFAWLVRLVPEAACYGAQLQHLLSDPAVAALLAATPHAGRVLRPLCRMLGVTPGPALTPSVARERAPAPGSPARGSPARGSPGRGRDAAAQGAIRARRSRIPRSSGLAWLRWRPAGAAP